MTRASMIATLCGLLSFGCSGGGGDTNQNQNNNNNNTGPATCGNGHVDPGEECDDGADNSDLAPDACRTNCRLPHCGDGVTDTGEECDDGNASNADGCLTSTTSEADTCKLNTCGDGWVDMTVTADGTRVEMCDHGGDLVGATCREDCGQDYTLCGNGTLEQGEACDPGQALLSDTAPNACRTNCQAPSCGDGVIDTNYGETCDGSALGGAECSTLNLGFVGGVLACDTDACTFDTSGCLTCIPDGPEQCDGIDHDCDGDPMNGFDTLTDPDHCGSCDNKCGVGEVCVIGVCD